LLNFLPMIVQMCSLLKNHNPCAGYAVGRYAAKPNIMKSNKSIVGISISWAFIAALIGAICWILILTFIHPLVLGESLEEIIRFSESRIVGAFYFGGFIAVLCIVPYSFFFFIYIKLKEKFNLSGQTKLQNGITSFILSLPLVITVFISTVIPTGSLGPFWSRAFELATWVLIATWCAILISKLLVNSKITQHNLLHNKRING